MKLYNLLIASTAAAAMFASCSDDDPAIGCPVIDYHNPTTSAHFGDSIPFSVKASDLEVPLSTLKARLYYGEDMVEEVVIRTKESGKDYEGKIYVPYYANIPDGTATLELVLQNINFTITTETYDLPITHADYPYLTLKTDDDTEYRMSKTATNEYAYTGKLPQKVKGYIVSPVVGDNGNEVIFGYENNEVKVNAESGIPFSNSKAGKYTISFNTYSFEASPFVVLSFNDKQFESIDDATSQIDMSLVKGQTIQPNGFPNFEEWWIDTDFLTKNEDGTLTFTAISGNYRFIADMNKQYFRVEVLGSDGKPASLADDGSGALWVIGSDFGKPSLSANETGWVTEKAVCMAPVAEKVYQMTLVGGKTVKTTSTDFKFYGDAMSWGNEFKCDRITSTSDIIKIGDGVVADNGNLYLVEGASLKENVIYVFTVDMTAGPDNAVLSVTENGEQAFEEKRIFLNNQKMTTTDNSVYSLAIKLNQGEELEFNTVDGLDEYYIDPDFFNYDVENDILTFLPVDGNYYVQLNKALGVISAQRLDESGTPITLGDDGHGAIYMLGWGCGHPSLDNQFGWTTSNAFGLAEISPKVYQFTAIAGPENGSQIGQRIRKDYIGIKFYWQKGWGGEFGGDNNLTLTDDAKAFVSISQSGDINLAGELEENATYVITIDLTAGNSNGILDVKKK